MDYSSMAEDVCHVMDANHLAEAAVLGHSMGGKTAMQLALLHPERVRKLVVVDMAPRAYPPWHEKIIAGMLSLDLSLYKSRQEMETALAPAVPNISTRQFLLKNVERGPDDSFRWKIGLEEIKQNYPRLREAITNYRSFERPALFIHGEKSDFFLESDREPIKRLFPLALFRSIAGAGHLVHVENVEAFLTAVINFLQDL
jgi:pimeloyl-ACP methyl ester carboxylesterase